MKVRNTWVIPALGCCGLCDKEATVMMSPLLTKNSKCDYTIYLSKVADRGLTYYVGIHPKLAERLVEQALTHNFLSLLKDIKSYEREKTRMNSRFDFVGVDREGTPFIMEVKNVPLADYVDCTASEKKKLKLDENDYKVTDKIAYFPDGYRKKNRHCQPPCLETYSRTYRDQNNLPDKVHYVLCDPTTRCILLPAFQCRSYI